MDIPIRKVRSNGRTIVGLLSSKKNTSVQFESNLEENFLYLLSFDDRVKTYYSQPDRIPYVDPEGKERTYVPDFLVEYAEMPSVLFEVKTREWIKKNKKQYKVCSDAGKKFAAGKGWEFQVITDRELRTEFVRNVRFLFRFQDYPIDPEREKFIIDKLRGRGIKIENLVEMAGENEPDILATIWAMLFQKRLSTSLTTRLTMHSTVKLPSTEFEIKYQYL